MTKFKSLNQSPSPDQNQGESTPQPKSIDTETQKKIESLIERMEDSMLSEQIQAIADTKIIQEISMHLL